jgi:hypothetical protein
VAGWCRSRRSIRSNPLLGLLLAVVLFNPGPTDTLRLRTVAGPPAADGHVDSTAWGDPQIRIPTRQGSASIWLLRAGDSVFIAASLPDATPSWADALAICFDVGGDGGDAPQHDDFQWSFQRVLDSSVVYRGRAGRWEPPHDDPDWRLGPDHSGGGWQVSSDRGVHGWTIVLRLDPAWLDGQDGRRPRVGFRIHDDDPNGWYPWPAVEARAGATLLERTPALWVPLK